MERSDAKKIIEGLRDIDGILDQFTEISFGLPDKEAQIFRIAIAETIAFVYEKLERPLYEQHPDLKGRDK